MLISHILALRTTPLHRCLECLLRHGVSASGSASHKFDCSVTESPANTTCCLNCACEGLKQNKFSKRYAIANQLSNCQTSIVKFSNSLIIKQKLSKHHSSNLQPIKLSNSQTAKHHLSKHQLSNLQTLKLSNCQASTVKASIVKLANSQTLKLPSINCQRIQTLKLPNCQASNVSTNQTRASQTRADGTRVSTNVKHEPAQPSHPPPNMTAKDPRKPIEEQPPDLMEAIKDEQAEPPPDGLAAINEEHVESQKDELARLTLAQHMVDEGKDPPDKALATRSNHRLFGEMCGGRGSLVHDNSYPYSCCGPPWRP